MANADSNSLCLECGLCCNGVIFADVQLQPGDDPSRLTALGLNLRSSARLTKFSQPCTALEGCRCRIYADRPRYCRQFECLVLKAVKTGQLDRPAAIRVIRRARRRADLVRRLLSQLGDANESLPLNRRFHQLRRRLESSNPDRETASIFSRLTLAVQDLNILLSEKFYPPDGVRP